MSSITGVALGPILESVARDLDISPSKYKEAVDRYEAVGLMPPALHSLVTDLKSILKDPSGLGLLFGRYAGARMLIMTSILCASWRFKSTRSRRADSSKSLAIGSRITRCTNDCLMKRGAAAGRWNMRRLMGLDFISMCCQRFWMMNGVGPDWSRLGCQTSTPTSLSL